METEISVSDIEDSNMFHHTWLESDTFSSNLRKSQRARQQTNPDDRPNLQQHLTTLIEHGKISKVGARTDQERQIRKNSPNKEQKQKTGKQSNKKKGNKQRKRRKTYKQTRKTRKQRKKAVQLIIRQWAGCGWGVSPTYLPPPPRPLHCTSIYRQCNWHTSTPLLLQCKALMHWKVLHLNTWIAARYRSHCFMFLYCSALWKYITLQHYITLHFITLH